MAAIASLKPDQSFKCMQTPDDLAPYAGRIVAVKTNSYYFSGVFSEEQCDTFIIPNTPWVFAHVSEHKVAARSGEGYHLNLFKQIKGVYTSVIANESNLKSFGPLQIRPVSTFERGRIKSALISSEAFASFSTYDEAPAEVSSAVLSLLIKLPRY